VWRQTSVLSRRIARFAGRGYFSGIPALRSPAM